MAKYTPAQKQSAQKWDKANMRTIGCKIRKDVADQFQKYCDNLGKTPNAVLKDYINKCIEISANDNPE